MKLEKLHEDTKSVYAQRIVEWYFCDQAKRPILFDSKPPEIRVRGVVQGGEHNGKTITTSPVTNFKNQNGNYIITTESGSSYMIAMNEINPKYRSTLHADMIGAILANVRK